MASTRRARYAVMDGSDDEDTISVDEGTFVGAAMPSRTAASSSQHRRRGDPEAGTHPRRRPDLVERHRWLFTLLLCVLLAAALAVTITAAMDKLTPHTYSHAAVSTDVQDCSYHANKVLRDKNGNAVDAAVVAALCLGVAHPQSSGIGGGGFLLRVNGSDMDVVDFREMAPAAYGINTYTGDANCTSEDPNMREFCSSRLGGRAVAVPGEIKGLYAAWQRWGRVPWKELVEPIAEMASDGVEVTEQLEAAIKDREEFLKRDPVLADLFLRKGKPLTAGRHLKNKPLGDTLRAIAENGPDAFYAGEIAQGIVDAVSSDQVPGTLTLQDLIDYQPVFRKPINTTFANYTVLSAPAPASGSVLGLILSILDRYDTSVTPPRPRGSSTRSGIKAPLEFDEPYPAHLLVEAFKFAYAQRTRLADPCCNATGSPAACTNTTQCDAVTSLQDTMRDPSFVSDIISKLLINSTSHDPSFYGADFDVMDTPGTTHFSIVGPDGDAVAVTSTINLHFGAKVLTKHGILLNNEMDDFSSPGITNAFGLEPSPANFIHPGKRPLSSSAPMIAMKDGKVALVAGASGGSRITSATAQVAARVLSHVAAEPDKTPSLQGAINSPRLHHQLLPKNILAEKDVSDSLQDELVNTFGHYWNTTEDYIGVVQGVLRLQNDKLQAASDPRKGGEPDGF